MLLSPVSLSTFPSHLNLEYFSLNCQGLQDTAAQFITVDCTLKEIPGSEDGSHIFEVNSQ